MASEQRHAVTTALTSQLSVITGGPGTGKTLIQRFLLDIYRRKNRGAKIICCAPTGRAARRMEQSTGFPATTIHKALGLLAGEDGDYCEPEMLDADLIVVDEVSMMDIYLANHLFRSVPHGSQLVLIGDADQLPSVGPGAVLSEIIACGAVPVVRLDRIFRQSYGSRIAAILTPRAYWHSKGINRPGKVKDLPPTHWNSSSVIKMLSVQEYCGDILNFKTYSKSYKNKKRLENDRENWAIFKDVHEPIIERAVFEQVQQKRGKMRKRQAKDGERSMFSGLLVCADCGSNLHFHFNQGNPEIKYFNCSNYKGNRGTCGSTHYVRVDFLEQVVLGEIRRLTKYAGLYEDDFLKEVIGHSRQAEETERRLKEKELKSLLARDDELDGLFERIYEDNVSGKLSDDRFAKMSRRYEEEQKELSEKIKKLRSEIEKQSSRATSTDMFVSIVRKYTRARKLTPRMLNELVEKIEVYNAEKIDGEWVQRLRIHYNCVGEMNIPNEPALPIPAVTVNTRKGVFVSYTTDDRPAV